MSRSPLDLHGSTPAELKARLEADRAGRPYIVYRDGDDRQVIYELDESAGRVVVGRSPRSEIVVNWDGGVSWTHAHIDPIGDDWVVVDDGLSANGTFVEGQRVAGQRRLEHNDHVRVGSTLLAFQAPSPLDAEDEVARLSTVPLDEPPDLTAAQRRVLVALCRPNMESGRGYTATNREIADELNLAVVTVKAHLRALADLHGVADFPPNQKRAELMHRARHLGVIKDADYT